MFMRSNCGTLCLRDSMAFENAKTWLVLPLLLLVANCTQHSVHGKPQVPCLFIFGDSLSDSGNNNNLQTSAKCNYEPYGIDFPIGPTGRFTNGRTVVDIITQFLGFENFIPPFANTSGSDILKGVNYASGGAGIRDETGSHAGSIISLRLQLANHRVIVSKIATRLGSLEKAQQYLNKCLYYVNIGSNDYINNYFQPDLYQTSQIYSLEQYSEVLVDELSQYLLDLHDVGGRKYVLAGLGLLGCTPNAIYNLGTNGSCFEDENDAAFIFNENLKSLVDLFNEKFSANSKFIFMNGTAKDDKKLQRFAVSKSACCPSGLQGKCIRNQRPCHNRNGYVFWDEFHPTEAWNLVTAITYYNSSDPKFYYPMHIKLLVDQEIKMEWELQNEFTSHLSAIE